MTSWSKDLLPIAANITEATRSIPLVTPIVVTAIVEASYVQTKYLVHNKYQKLKVLENVKQNLKALNLIVARSELVAIMHGTFLEELHRLQIYRPL